VLNGLTVLWGDKPNAPFLALAVHVKQGVLGVRPLPDFDEFYLESPEQAHRFANSASGVRNWTITDDFWRQPHISRSLAYSVAEGKLFPQKMDDFDLENPKHQDIAVQMFMDFHLEQSINDREADIDGIKVKDELQQPETADSQIKRKPIEKSRGLANPVS